ncbi:MAG: Sip1-related alpha-galactosidase, partial [Clostridiales bacterium]|nr:Sip1-related alpha-galactosidase [Clostridiales bacterium]
MQSENSAETLKEGVEMLDKIKPWIMLDDNTKIPMLLSKKDGNVYFFEDDKGRAELKLVVKERGNIKAVLVDARVEPDNGIKCLNSECAVGLDIESIGDIKGYMADYLQGKWWCQPYTGIDIKAVPRNTQALLWENRDGSFAFMLPVCDQIYKCTINGSEDGMTLKLFSWHPGLSECKSLAFILAEGENPFELSEKCVEYGFELLDRGFKARKDRRYPEIFEYLGWCSWDALQIRVGTDGLLKKCEEFKQKEIPVKWAIIDDMWAEVKGLNDLPEDIPFDKMCAVMHESGLYSFEADHVRFPNGLKACIDKIKSGYGLKVGIWHPTTGYWKGIDPEGPVAREYSDVLVETEDGCLVQSPQIEKSF